MGQSSPLSLRIAQALPQVSNLSLQLLLLPLQQGLIWACDLPPGRKSKGHGPTQEGGSRVSPRLGHQGIAWTHGGRRASHHTTTIRRRSSRAAVGPGDSPNSWQWELLRGSLPCAAPDELL